MLLLLYGMRSLQYHEFAEAGAAVLSAVRKFRRVIRDRIHAQDLVQVIRIAESCDEIAAILRDNADAFGFVHMEVCRESARRNGGGRRNSVRGGQMWRLDYPVVGPESQDDNPYVLRVWCNPDDGFRPYGAERVARILAPVIEGRLADVVRVARAEERVEGRVIGGEGAGVATCA